MFKRLLVDGSRLRPAVMAAFVLATAAVTACTGDGVVAPANDESHVPPGVTVGSGGFVTRVDSIVLFSNDGARKSVVSPYDQRDVKGPPSSPGTDKLDMTALKERLHEFSGLYTEGSEAVALLVQIATAFEAPDDNERRKALAKLPVAVLTSRTEHEFGVRRDYFVKGVLKASLFLVAGHGLFAGQAIGGTPFVGSAAVVSDWCETEFQGEIYYDECTTQQDLDEAASIIAALEYDVENLENEFYPAVSAFCDVHPEECPEPESWDGGLGESSSIGYLVAASRSGLVIANLSGTGTQPGCEESAYADSAASSGCFAEAVGAVTALFGWGLAKDAAHGLMMLGTVTAKRALIVGLGGTVSAALAVGVGVGAFLACVE